MNPSALLLFATALAIACATPGPSTTAVVARVLARGLRGTAWLCLGLLLGELFWLLCAIFGVAALAQQFHLLFVAIKFAGVAYLFHLAWKFWRTPLAASPSGEAGGEGGHPCLAGVALALANPKTMLFYVALLPSLVGLDDLPLRDVLVLALVAGVVVGTILATYVLTAERIGRHIQSPRALRRIYRGSAALMAGAAGAMATR